MASAMWANGRLDQGDRSIARKPAAGSANRLLNRAFDVAVALALILFLGPLLAVIALLVRMTSKGPVIFGHSRLGRNGRSFKCLKFRSMVSDSQERLAHYLAENPEARLEWERDHKLRNDPRITSIGAFLRKSSLDELPQLFNVLRGEMSLVGPRPIVTEEVHRYGRYFSCYAKVRPGITGLWQISGRSDTTYRRRVALDVAYSRSQSLSLNLKILIMTVPSVMMAKGSR